MIRGCPITACTEQRLFCTMQVLQCHRVNRVKHREATCLAVSIPLSANRARRRCIRVSLQACLALVLQCCAIVIHLLGTSVNSNSAYSASATTHPFTLYSCVPLLWLHLQAWAASQPLEQNNSPFTTWYTCTCAPLCHFTHYAHQTTCLPHYRGPMVCRMLLRLATPGSSLSRYVPFTSAVPATFKSVTPFNLQKNDCIPPQQPQSCQSSYKHACMYTNISVSCWGCLKLLVPTHHCPHTHRLKTHICIAQQLACAQYCLTCLHIINPRCAPSHSLRANHSDQLVAK